MPLLRGMARTAVIAGTATTVSNRVSRRRKLMPSKLPFIAPGCATIASTS